MEGEDYDGQSGATKEDSNDTDLGQSISVTAGGSIFYDNVDFSDAGVNAVKLRVQAAAATNIEFHADTATGTLLGKCDDRGQRHDVGDAVVHGRGDGRPPRRVPGLLRRCSPELDPVPGRCRRHGHGRHERHQRGRRQHTSGAGGNVVTGAGGTGRPGAGGSNTTSGAGGSNTTSGAGGSNTTSGAGGNHTTSGAGGSNTTSGAGGDTTSGAGGSPVTGGGSRGAAARWAASRDRAHCCRSSGWRRCSAFAVDDVAPEPVVKATRAALILAAACFAALAPRTHPRRG